MKSIFNAGWSLGKKVALTGAVITAAPVILPPLMVVSALGFAFSVPFGLVFAGYVCNQKVMSYLLPAPYLPQEGLEMLEEEDLGDDAEGEERLHMQSYLERPDYGSGLLDGEMVGAEGMKMLPEESAQHMEKQSDEKEVGGYDSSGASAAVNYETKEDDVDREEEPQTREDEVERIIRDEDGAIPPEKNLHETAVDEADVHGDASLTSDTNVYDDTGREQSGETRNPRGTEKAEENGVLRTGTIGSEIDERATLGDSPLAAVVKKGDSAGREQQSGVADMIDENKEKSIQEEEWILPADTGVEENNYGVSFGVRGDDAAAQGPKQKVEELTYAEKTDDNTGVDNGGLHVGVRKEREEEEVLLKENGEGIRADDKFGNFPLKIDSMKEDFEGFDESKKREHKTLEEDSAIEIKEGEIGMIPPGGTCDIHSENVSPVENIVQETEDKVEEEEDRDKATKNKAIILDIQVKEVDESEEPAMILGADDHSSLPRSSEEDLVSTYGVTLVPDKASTSKDKPIDEHTGVQDGHELNLGQSASEEHYMEEKDGESIQQPLPSASSTEVPQTGTASEAETKSTETMGHPVSYSRPSGVSSEVEASEASDEEGLYSEEKIWNQINALRTIVGYKAELQVSFVEELKALYVFTGMDPPASSDGSSDLAQATDKLRFLKAVIGVR
ncbi:uncharacterized protein [Aristolochia californica]|uniref:uncharacterized protein n=1 Tax=Aristolochia californica TaxID=171875 RepID=UPI0035D94B99